MVNWNPEITPKVTTNTESSRWNFLKRFIKRQGTTLELATKPIVIEFGEALEPFKETNLGNGRFVHQTYRTLKGVGDVTFHAVENGDANGSSPFVQEPREVVVDVSTTDTNKWLNHLILEVTVPSTTDTEGTHKTLWGKPVLFDKDKLQFALFSSSKPSSLETKNITNPIRVDKPQLGALSLTFINRAAPPAQT
jgi:hypothetical protein